MQQPCAVFLHSHTDAVIKLNADVFDFAISKEKLYYLAVRENLNTEKSKISIYNSQWQYQVSNYQCKSIYTRICTHVYAHVLRSDIIQFGRAGKAPMISIYYSQWQHQIAISFTLTLCTPWNNHMRGAFYVRVVCMIIM